jgi:hypothetical protein
MKCATTILMMVLYAVSGRAAFPLADGFNTYLPGQTFVTATNGWQASTNLIKVVASPSTNTANSAEIACGVLTNTVAYVTPGVVWTEFYVKPVWGDAPDNPPTNTVSFMQYFTTNGSMAIATSAGFLVITNDMFGRPVLPVNTNTFSRISLYQNFATTNSALLLDGVVLLQDLHFPGSSLSYSNLAVGNNDAAAYLDEVSISLTVPASSDGNGDSITDANELNTFGYVARTNFTVGPGQLFSTLQAAINMARARDKIVITTNAFSETLTIDHSVTFYGMAFTNTGSLAITASGSLNLQTNVTVSSLVMSGSAVLNVSSATFAVVSPRLNLTGTFSISAADWNSAPAQAAIPFADDFEMYAVGTRLTDLGFRGWAASDTNAITTNSPVYGGVHSAAIVGTVSNRIAGAGVLKVWMDFRLQPVSGEMPAADTNGAAVMLYVGTNGYLNIYNGGVWDMCSNGVWGASASALTAGQYNRVTIHVDYTTSRVAVFANGVLLRELLHFPFGNSAALSALCLGSADGAVYLDNLTISESEPSGLDGDANKNRTRDSLEIHLYGRIATDSGSIFMLR